MLTHGFSFGSARKGHSGIIEGVGSCAGTLGRHVMTKTLMGLLLAATTLVPGMASAQDEGQRPDMRQVRERALRQDGGGNRPQRRAERPGTDMQANVQIGAQVSGDRGGWRGDDRRVDRQDRQPRLDQQQGRPTWADDRPQRQQDGADRQPVRVDRRDDGPNGRADRGDGRSDARRSDGRGMIRSDRGNWRNSQGQGWQNGQTGQGWNGQRWQGNGIDQRRAYDRGRASQQWNRNGADWRDNDRARNGFDDRRSWNLGWRNDNRYDWNGYRAQNRSRYRLPRYYAPQGWGNGYRRFSVGLRLQSILFDQNYWIQDPWTYRLPEAYGPYRWVRYYDDALLVDLDSGRVIDTVYGIFW